MFEESSCTSFSVAVQSPAVICYRSLHDGTVPPRDMSYPGSRRLPFFAVIFFLLLKIRVQHWCRVRLSSSRSSHVSREACRRRHRLCRFLRDRHLARVCRRALRFDFHRDYRRSHNHRCCCRAARRRCSRCSCDLDFRRCCRASLRDGAPQSLVSVFFQFSSPKCQGSLSN